MFEVNAGGRKTRVIPRDYQLDPVNGAAPCTSISCASSPGQTVTVEVPVHCRRHEDAAPGIKRGGTVR